ncbi:NADP-dependent oxidoreductase [Planotetraspora sp. A-T 1434]|uniref:NADP-dependent oxidoreductase n=1 Tax=Planotetraspora sp. A-T 1434 TaxID=2979219 RepID=UPI0021C2485A|nr:NADP-dependent oxidoreductase [Planotetraspora sp. A-T 1434]MCT9935289.1 NADP-dependent oxidoreductase [Planotetraspora sp. A-T 1434]
MRACGVAGRGAGVELLELPEPPAPGPGQMVIGVEAAGVGPWDRLIAAGGWDVGLDPPAALGVEGAGRVARLGPGVEGFAVGDPVVAHEAPLPGGSGFWAERVLVTAAHVARVGDRPSGLDPVAAAALPVAGLTARQALDALGLEPGQRLLITGGAGGTGALAVQLAARDGLVVTTTASAGAMRRLGELGATTVVDYRVMDWAARVEGRFDGALVAAAGTSGDALGLVRDGGRLCSLTSDARAGERGVISGNLYVRPDAHRLAELAAMVARRTLTVFPEAVPLAEGPAAFARVAAGRAGGRKLVLTL